MARWICLVPVMVMALDAEAAELPLQGGSQTARAGQASEEMVRFDWMNVSAKERARWGIVEVVPGEFSGDSFVYGETPVLDAKGDVVGGRGGVEAIVYQGRWTYISRWSNLGASIPKDGKFAWSDPFLFEMRREKPAALSTPLLEGRSSLLLVRWKEEPRPKEVPLPGNLKAERPWDRMLLLPPGWEKAFPEAWKRQAEVEAVLAPGREPDWNAVRKLALDPSGPVALAAVQRLLAAGRLDASGAKPILAAARGANIAVLVYAVASQLPEKELEPLQKVLVALAGRAVDAADARGWAAGGLATANFAWQKRAQTLLGRAVLEAARVRGKTLGLDPKADRDFYEVEPGGTDVLNYDDFQALEKEGAAPPSK